MAVSSRKAARIPNGFPPGRRSPRGKLRWYLAQVPRGREQTTCDKVRSIVSHDVLDDAFVMRKERWRKAAGVWRLDPIPMYEEYFFVTTRDVAALDAELAKLSFSVRVAGSDEHAYIPLDADAQMWFERMMDDEHVLRNSTGVIIDGELHVKEGPLAGQELQVSKIDRHKRRCTVRVCGGNAEGEGAYTEQMPMEVPFKS